MTKTRKIFLLAAGFVLAFSGLISVINTLLPAESAKALPPTHTPQPTTMQSLLATPPPPQPMIAEGVSPAAEPQAVLLPEMTLTDEQGAVIIEITPVTSKEARNTINFKVILNTHSVDLSMDLAALSTLTTDNGLNLQAVLWDAPRGGHHLEGNLSFAAFEDEMALLAGAQTLTLAIQNLDVPKRIFTWELQ